MVVLQALSEYLVKRPPSSDLNLLVELSVPGRSDVRWNFIPKVAYVARSSNVRMLWKTRIHFYSGVTSERSITGGRFEM